MIEKNQYSLNNITNQDIITYIDERFKPVDQELWRLRLEAEAKHIPIIERDVESLLRTLLMIHKPKRILEVGTAIGYSASVMARTLPSCRIVTLERDSEMIENANINFVNLKTDEQVTMLEGDAKEILKKLPDEAEEPFDFVFIDGAKSHYLTFWKEIIKMVKTGSLIVCDNVLMRGMTVDSKYDLLDKHRTNIRRMREFIEYIVDTDEATSSVLTVGDGVSISCIK